MIPAPDAETELTQKLQAVRWRSGLRCPRCGHGRVSLHARGRHGRRKLRCAACARTFNDLTGTPLARTHLPLCVWAAAARIVAAGPVTCSELARRLELRVPTAWRMRRILSQAMIDPDLREVLLSEETQ